MSREDRIRQAVLMTVDSFCATHQPRDYWLKWWLRAQPSKAGEQMIKANFARISGPVNA